MQKYEKNVICVIEEASAMESSGNERENIEVTEGKQFCDVCGDAIWSNQEINGEVKPDR